ncbi:MAG: MBL fold metallo-hydrolase [Chloroflexota bacterium]
MLLQQFFDAGLGHASYLVADTDAGVAFLVDPDRAVDVYLAAASKLDVLITHSFETHVHNDYLSGSRALAELRPIAVVAGPDARIEYPHTTLRDGEDLDVAALRVRCVATPGHTPEHVSFLVSDLRRADDPQYLFSGGALLVGHIARVDLLGPELEEQLARDAYATLREKVLSLADYVAVFPTHGGGSACTASVVSSRWTTLGFERRHNDIALAAGGDFGAFRETIARGLPIAPAYYPHVRALNYRGVTLPDRRPLPLLSEWMPPSAALLDPRPPQLYGAGHRRGALNIVGNDGFAVRCGAVVPYGTPIVLLTRDEEQAERLRAQLSIIGFDDVRGYAEPIGATDDATATTQQLDARTAGRLVSDGAPVLDVREGSEYSAGHVRGAQHIPYEELEQRIGEVPRMGTLVVYCASGVRSSLATSIFERHGIIAANVRGGFTAWRNAGLPIEEGR